MNPIDPGSSVSRRAIAACLALALIVGFGAWILSPPDGSAGEGGAPSDAATAKLAPRVKESKGGELAGAEAAQVPVVVAPPVDAGDVLPGHEGHGDECAQCLAERKLFVYREDFAQLHFTRIHEEFELDEGRSAELLDACRRFARAVLTEWSFSDSKPRLPDDAVLESRRHEILGPLLGDLSRKPEDNL